MAADVRWLGHSAFHLSGGGADVLIDPFLTGNPKAAATADEVPADVILLTHGHGDHLGDTVDIAKRTGATVVAIVELAAEIREQRRRERPRPQLRRHGQVRLGLGEARPRLAHRGLAVRHRAHARRPADPLRRPPDLPPRRHRAVRRPEADRRPRRPGRARAGADRRPLHDGPLRRRHRRRADQPVPDDPDPLRDLPARGDRRRRPSSRTSRTRASREVLVLDPGDTHTLR